ncbi:MAG: hypothetical protein IVW53_14785 [Chloroflexi bacterium]|nr:hypothetical protein [Chloroflexota bacterium]MBF6606832.1 hypothetical protein [Chloroflexota bacterium]
MRTKRPLTSPGPSQFADYVESRPPQLGCWRDGALGLYPMLAWLNTHPVVEQRKRIATEGPLFAAFATTRAHHNQVGVAVGWTTEHMTGSRRARASTEQERVALFDLAGRHWLIRNLLAEVRQGVRRYEADGTRIVLRYDGDNRLDALDRLLGLVDDLDSIADPPTFADGRLPRWLAGGGRDVPWRKVPLWAKEQYRTFAARLIDGYPSYLPGDLDVGGFTMAEATRVWVELMARGAQMHACTLHGSVNASVVVPMLVAGDLIDELAEASAVDVQRVGALANLLTLDLRRRPDPCLTPLVPIAGDRLVPMSSLIIPSSPIRNLTALLQRDPASFGKAGNLLGLLGARTTAATLGRLSGARVETGVKVLRDGGSQAGDLDVVAYDPSEGTMVIFEVMWQIDPDGSAEVARSEERAHEKRAQVARLRSEMDGGQATARWPASWPDCSSVRARWFIVTPNVLPVRIVEPDGITIRSHQMLARMLRAGASVSDLIRLLDDPPHPPSELLQTQWKRVRYGDYRVEFDSIVA